MPDYFYADVNIANLNTDNEFNVVSSRSTVLVAKNCWMAQTVDPSVSQFTDMFISDGCPNAFGNSSMHNVQVIESGQGSRARFAFNLDGTSATTQESVSVQEVIAIPYQSYIHCTFELCDTNAKSCVPTC